MTENHLTEPDAAITLRPDDLDDLLTRATERGAVTARTLDAVAVGDRVQIKNGIATKAPVAKQVFPV
jgi:hypothetical protein